MYTKRVNKTLVNCFTKCWSNGLLPITCKALHYAYAWLISNRTRSIPVSVTRTPLRIMSAAQIKDLIRSVRDYICHSRHPAFKSNWNTWPSAIDLPLCVDVCIYPQWEYPAALFGVLQDSVHPLWMRIRGLLWRNCVVCNCICGCTYGWWQYRVYNWR